MNRSTQRILTGLCLLLCAMGAQAQFNPNNIAGLKMWLKADAGVYTDNGTTLAANGQTVQLWQDQSGSGINASQGTAANRPTYVTNAQNGLPCLRFSGASSTSMTFSLTITSDISPREQLRRDIQLSRSLTLRRARMIMKASQQTVTCALPANSARLRLARLRPGASERGMPAMTAS